MKTAKKAEPVEKMRNDAIDWLAVQIARPKRHIENRRLKRHVHGPLGSADELGLRSFLKRPEGSEFYLSFDSMKGLERFDRLLERSGLFKNIECTYTREKDPDTGKMRLEVTVTMEERELGQGQAKKLLKPLEKDLLEVARKEEEERKKARMPDEDDPLVEMLDEGIGDDPLAGATPVKMDMEKEEPGRTRAKKEPEVMPLPRSITDSDGDTVPLIPGKKARSRLEDAIENGKKFTFEVKGSSRMEKFLDREWLKRHGINPNRAKITKVGRRSWSITINGELSSEEAAKQEFERLVEEMKKASREA
ncbi:hypothetical protein GF412_02300 [Candidatus Micrarchaeota archaeon]|nr:hypothetical protein [Candidatus Micrarchaeota archaeon]MBD3417791.1 hypothetical protein [Candidatus Micrarchaeota archaeon]